ncbi:uncharacterized protein LOC136025376 [Artemia franciscana]|uniref:CYTH domain-containing protein n=1 Tax=Artemia franciscana TaxID=6661 RepID=A0AA88HRY4_ARTSF|nr:hypothetical protein QYM36_011203 [Artemia franciscana]
MMAQNAEIKARVNDVDALEIAARRLSGRTPEIIFQDDTFFNVPNGRLKLRKFRNDAGELIFYDRPDSSGPKISTYSKTDTSEPDILAKTLEMALGIRGRVQKTRKLYMVDQTRVHIDKVEKLPGFYAELEVCLNEDQTPEDGKVIAEKLMEQLGIDKADLLTGAYLDLLQNQD